MKKGVQLSRFDELYLRAKALGTYAIDCYAEMEREVLAALNALEKELDDEQRRLDALIAREEETGRCGTCGKPILECECEEEA